MQTKSIFFDTKTLRIKTKLDKILKTIQGKYPQSELKESSALNGWTELAINSEDAIDKRFLVQSLKILNQI